MTDDVYANLHRVRVRAFVDFEAYANIRTEGQSLTDRIKSELEDAIFYRAPHLTDFEGSESWDALAVLAGPIDQIELVVDIKDPADAEEVRERARSVAGEVF